MPAWLTLLPVTDDNNNIQISSSPLSTHSLPPQLPSHSHSITSSPAASAPASPTRKPSSKIAPFAFLSLSPTPSPSPSPPASLSHSCSTRPVESHTHDHHPTPNSFLRPMVLQSPPRRKKSFSSLAHHSLSSGALVLPLLENPCKRTGSRDPARGSVRQDCRTCFEVRGLQVCDIERIKELHCTSLPVRYPGSFFFSLLGANPGETSLVATLPSTMAGGGYFDGLHQPGHPGGVHHVTSPLSGRKPISLDTVGCITARIVPAVCPSMRILTLCVAPDFRRLGVARLLLDRILLRAKAAARAAAPPAGPRRLAVNLHVQATNRVAHRFYRRAGFRTITFKPGYYLHNDLKPLDPALKKMDSDSDDDELEECNGSLEPENCQVVKHISGRTVSDTDAWFLELEMDF